MINLFHSSAALPLSDLQITNCFYCNSLKTTSVPESKRLTVSAASVAKSAKVAAENHASVHRQDKTAGYWADTEVNLKPTGFKKQIND